MTVYKPKKSRIWHYDFIVDGQRYYGPTGVLTRRAAEGVERNKRNEVARGEYGAVARMTFDAAAGRYWEEKGKHRGDADDVERRIAVLLQLIGKTTKLSEIHQAKVAEVIEKRRGMTYTKRRGHMTDEMRAKARKRDREKGPPKQHLPSDATVNRDVIDTLRPILRRARTHWTPKNSQHGLPEIDWGELRLSEPRELSRVYSARERQGWLETCEAENIRLALDMMLTYGLRFGEVFFPPDAFMPETDDGPVLKLQKGRKKDVLLYLPIRPDHARQLAALAGRARAAGLPHLWFDEVGGKLKPLTQGQVEYRMRKAADRGGVSGDRRIHGARHHAGSTILRKTKNLKAVQRLLGHATIASTQRYAHVLIDDLRAALEDDIPRNSPEAPAPGKRKA